MAKGKFSEIKQIDVLSAGKSAGIIYGLLATISSLLVLLLSYLSPATLVEAGITQTIGLSELVYPIVVGLLIGFISGILVSALYNLITKYIGGIKIKLE